MKLNVAKRETSPMSMFKALALVLCLCASTARAGSLIDADEMEKNPIRRVVTLLQQMKEEVEEEGRKEKELYDKFMCFCEGNTKGMTKASEDAKQKILELTGQIENMVAEKARLEQELVQHQKDRETAKQSIAAATKLREKEHADFVEAAGEQKANLDAINQAIPVLERGMGITGMLQSSGGGYRVAQLRKLAMVWSTRAGLDDYEKQTLVSFLADKQGSQVPDYAPRSGEIVGILKQMKDQINADLGGVVEQEETAQKLFEEMVAAKNAEIQAATEAIEAKTKRAGEVAGSIVEAKDDLEDTTKELSDTEKFMTTLSMQCDEKSKDWEARQKTRMDELTAISEAIAVLNDDDALDMFKKTLPTPGQPKNSA